MTTKQLTIREEDGQLIVPATDLDTWTAPNPFLGHLVAQAERDGAATGKDAEGCEVTAVVEVI
jgi:hypothetical protein